MRKSGIYRQRRRFLANAGTVAAVIPLAALIKTRLVFAADVPLVDEKSPQAAALKYVAVTAIEGQTCDNCALYRAVDDTDGAGNCPLFQGAHVADKAWCNAYAPKA